MGISLVSKMSKDSPSSLPDPVHFDQTPGPEIKGAKYETRITRNDCSNYLGDRDVL